MDKIRKLFFPFSILLNMILLVTIRKQRKYALSPNHSLMKSAFSDSHFPPACLLEQSINQARETLDIAIYNFDNPFIATSLIEAKQRGVRIRILIDQKKAHKPNVEQTILKLRDENIPVRLHESEKMHLKMTIVDYTTLLTGSFNYTNASANENVEQLFRLSNRTEAKKWSAIFDHLWAAAKKEPHE